MDFPKILADFHAIEIDYETDEIDYEPYNSFLSKEESNEWFRAWTGNSEVSADKYLIFGQDGTGGLTAFWLAHDSDDILMQPIVFFGSEGETGVVASCFKDFVWLFAQGYGPYEAVAYPVDEINELSQFLEFSTKHYGMNKVEPWEIVKRAKSHFPNFSSDIENLCR